jgi:hypothetical protein
MATNDVIVALRTAGLAAFKSAMDQASDSVGKVGTGAEDASGQVATASATAGKGAGKWRSMAKSMAGAAGAAVGITAVVGFAKSATNAAVDLNEEINKNAVVFGQSSKGLVDWTKNSATALGQSRQEALSAMGTFGNMLVPMGFARKRAADMSKGMVGLASDMASFNNADPSDVLEALRSGLAGETEPLRKFGVFLSDARLRQEALNQGLKVGKGPLDAATKAQATYGLILKDTKDAQGDFTRTSGGLANQQRILKAEWANMSAQVGTSLLPTLTKVAGVLVVLGQNMNIVLPIIGVLTTALIAYKVATIAAAIATGGLSASILLIPLAVAAVVAGLIIAYQKVEWFRAAVNAAFGAIKKAAVAVFGWIKGHWQLLVMILGGPFIAAVVVIIRNFAKIKTAARDAWNGIKSAFHGVVGFFTRIGAGIVNGIVDGIKSAPGALLDAIKSLLPGGKFGAKVAGFLGIGAHAWGGTMGRPGWTVVGERGPELVRLPGGSGITPLPAGGTALPTLAGAGAGAGNAQTTAHFYLDRRLIATAVAQDTADRKARR